MPFWKDGIMFVTKTKTRKGDPHLSYSILIFLRLQTELYRVFEVVTGKESL